MGDGDGHGSGAGATGDGNPGRTEAGATGDGNPGRTEAAATGDGDGSPTGAGAVRELASDGGPSGARKPDEGAGFEPGPSGALAPRDGAGVERRAPASPDAERAVPTYTPPLAALHALLAAEGGLLAGALADPAGKLEDGGTLGRRAGDGPRTRHARAEYELLVEAVVEGALLHASEGRVLRPADPDLALLAGDRLYALGLERLSALGDLAAVTELADAISLGAQALAEGRPELADAAWEAAVAAIAAGPSPPLAAAKAAARDGSPGGIAALRAAGRRASG